MVRLVRRLLASATGLAATVLALARTRIELATVEVELEARRWMELLGWLLVAVHTAVLGLLMAAFWLMLFFWESNRVLAAGLIAVVFFLISGLSATILLKKWRSKARFLEGSLRELANDVERIRGE